MKYTVRYSYYPPERKYPVTHTQKGLKYTSMRKLVDTIAKYEKTGCDIHVRPEKEAVK